MISCASSVDVGADLGADLDDRLVHLALDLIAEAPGALDVEQLGDVRAQLPRVGIDDLEFFLDADGERVLHARDHSATRWYPSQAPACLRRDASPPRVPLTSPSSL